MGAVKAAGFFFSASAGWRGCFGFTGLVMEDADEDDIESRSPVCGLSSIAEKSSLRGTFVGVERSDCL